MTQTVEEMPLGRSLSRLWGHIARRRRSQLMGVLLLTLASSVAEVLSIGAIFPFLGVLTAPDAFFAHPQVRPWVLAWGLTSPQQLILPLAIGFAMAAVVAGGARLALLKYSTRVTFATGADLSNEVYRRTLYQPYQVHVARNSSEVINGISTKVTGVIYGTLVPALTLVSSAIMLVAILVALLAIDPLIAIGSSVGFGLIYALIFRHARRRLTEAGQTIARESNVVVRAMQEGLGGIRDILIDGAQPAYCDAYRRADQALRGAQESNQFVSQGPRFVVEALGMVLIAGLAFWLVHQPGGAQRAVPVLGALALGAQRLLPVLQQVYASWSTMLGSQALLSDTLALLDQPLPSHVDGVPCMAVPFNQTLAVRGLSFRYAQGGPDVLQGIDLSVVKGDRIGIVGSTGSGKSTLIDVLMGLLPPSQGLLNVDGVAITPANVRAWQRHIAHVPQSIFLTDATIEENIAFGVPVSLIDQERVREAASQAQLAQTIEGWTLGYQTRVGERGIMLSGGQRQRIGIARALYKQADVIIFDEATSALDNDTERAVMDAIGQLDARLTVFMIAHRLTSLRHCTKVIEVDGGAITWQGAYEDMIGRRS
jgi:ABC-type multidrug transport system fused ATPase/permease subunit